METIKKYAGWITSLVVAVAAVVTFIYTKGAESAMFEGRTFDDPEQKVEVVTYVKSAPTPEKVWKKYLQDSIRARRDSINNVKAIESRNRRDSIMVEELKARKYADSINRLNSDQLYQTKQELKEIKALINKIND